MTAVLSPEEVREFIQDHVEKNRLLDGKEFENTQITLAIEMAVDRFNMFPPMSSATPQTFPSKTLLMYGTLSNLFAGQSALLARNHMSYSDGGITVAVEERMQLYTALAAMYDASFESSSKAIKIEQNMNEGWGSVSSDYANFPIF